LALAADDGRLVSFRVDEAGALTKVDEIEVAAGPYSGDLDLGHAVVSGGTCEITVLRVASSGELVVDRRFSASRGQPEVSIDPSAAFAVLSTHFSGDEADALGDAEFGLSLLELESGRSSTRLGSTAQASRKAVERRRAGPFGLPSGVAPRSWRTAVA